MKVYIPTDWVTPRKRGHFAPLAQPFFADGRWEVVEDNFMNRGITPEWNLVQTVSEADVVLFPMYVNEYAKLKKMNWVTDLCRTANHHKVASFLSVSGDFGEKFPAMPGLTYFRQGGFSNQLDGDNIGAPKLLSDWLNGIYKSTAIQPIPWEQKPVVGFCGHATLSALKAAYEYLKFARENARRFIDNPFRRDYEPLFASGLERWRLLDTLRRDSRIHANFIRRASYRAGAKTKEDMERTTREYYDNIRRSGYILCVRGGGNFSVRLYETLMMGRIPVFVDSECLLPFQNEINWKEHVVWVPWNQKRPVADYVSNLTKIRSRIPSPRFNKKTEPFG